MVNIIWVSLTVIGLVFAMCNGTLQDVNEAVFKGAKEAITISFGLMSVLVFWLGLMKIAEQSGLLDIFSRMCRPLYLNCSLIYRRITRRWAIFYLILWRISSASEMQQLRLALKQWNK